MQYKILKKNSKHQTTLNLNIKNFLNIDIFREYLINDHRLFAVFYSNLNWPV